MPEDRPEAHAAQTTMVPNVAPTHGGATIGLTGTF
jgi:hypothetical protein